VEGRESALFTDTPFLALCKEKDLIFARGEMMGRCGSPESTFKVDSTVKSRQESRPDCKKNGSKYAKAGLLAGCDLLLRRLHESIRILFEFQFALWGTKVKFLSLVF